MKEQIKMLRKTLGLTQQEFANRIGISRGNIATYETRDGNPGNSVIALICREFGVNETLLRTGAGEMFTAETSSELETLAKKYNLSRRVCVLVERFLDLKPGVQEAIVDYALAVSEALSNDSAALASAEQEEPAAAKGWRPMTDDEIEAELEDYRKELLAEREAAERSSALPKADGA